MKAVLEKIPEQARQSFYFSDYRQSRFNSPWHYHPQWELTWIERGEGIAYVGNVIRPFVEGELVLLGPMLPHCWKSDASDGAVVSYFAQWDDKLLGSHWLQGPEFVALNKLLQASRRGLLFDAQVSRELGEKLVQLGELAPFERLLSLLSILNTLSGSKFTTLCEHEAVQINTLAADRIERIIHYVENHYREEITANQLSELCSMTTSSFAKFFRKTFNKTFTQYLNEYRISRACSLLQSSKMSIEDIAFDVGYRNMSFFHRQFKNQCSSTPAAWRRAFLALNES
ncbi:helix-turn-helix domain-containing protein [Agaribacterium haliotis]|uniref:helix-turn-helix domain-containing protein n=1 Tax=Agaribacterium haliotis TaxID=2013869 RepID=UPI000BB5601A|nr:AraC family transcriptional regulator [Agaribacterium haliotis]